MMPNFVKIGQTVEEISRFCDFQDCGPRHLGFEKFEILTVWPVEGANLLHRAKFQQNRVSLTAKKTTEWVLNKAGVKRELLDTVKARKLAYYGHTMRKQGSCVEKEIMQGTMSGVRRRRRPRTAWMDNIKTWT